MAEYYPPTQDIPIFDTTNFIDVTECLTIEKANKKYLEFPYAQGDETLKGVTVEGIANFNAGFSVNGAYSDVNFNNYNSNFIGDCNILSSLGFYDTNEQQLVMYAGLLSEGRTAYILNYGQVGMFGSYIFMNNGISPGRISFRLPYNANPTVVGVDDFAIYADDTTQNGTITTKTGFLDILGTFAALGGTSTCNIRMISNKPSGSLSNDIIGSIRFTGYIPTNSIPQTAAEIRCFLTNNWTSTQKPTNLIFYTTNVASTVMRSTMALTEAGFLRIGTNVNTSSASLHVSTTNTSNPMVLIDAGATVTNFATIVLANDFTTNGLTKLNLRLALARVAGNFCSNSQPNDAVISMLNSSTTNCLRLSASVTPGSNAPTIDNNNTLRLGDEAINANATVTNAPLAIGFNATGATPCILVRGGVSGVTYGGRIDFKCPNSGANTIIMRTTNVDDMDITTLINGATCFFTGLNIGSSVTATYDCGTATAYWKNVRGLNAYIAVSDERKKIDIKPSTLGLDFINDLKPVSYKWGEYTDREHYGLIAQDVKASLDKRGKGDVGIWCLADKEDSDSSQALRYTELISPMIKAIQELTSLVKELRSEINELKANQLL